MARNAGARLALAVASVGVSLIHRTSFATPRISREAAPFMEMGALTPALYARSIALFIIAGMLEIGGGYLVWLWLREGRAVVLGVLGGLLLFVYGVIPTMQPAHFGRVYAAYGGVFVVLSILWGWWIDGHRPDLPEIVGSGFCLVGVAVIMYWPRGA